MAADAERIAAGTEVEPRRADATRRPAARRPGARPATPPRTEASKARARAEAARHGLTGAGIALPDEDRAAVEARFAELQAELQPGDVLGMVYVEQAALMSIRARRAAEREAAVIAHAARHAAAEFDRARLDEVDRLLDTITADPGPSRRRLLASTEGIDRLVAALTSVKDQVEGGRARSWGADEWALIEAFCGRRVTAFPVAPTVALMVALAGDLGLCGPRHPVHDVEPIVLDLWLGRHLRQHLAAELALLAEARAALDPAVLVADRAEAAVRARFDAGPAATAARKDEAAARRELHRALRDLRAHEATLAPRAEIEVEIKIEAGCAPPDPAAAGDDDAQATDQASSPPVRVESPAPAAAQPAIWPEVEAVPARGSDGPLRE